MSDAGKDQAATASNFTDRELQMLGWAMQSLKSGPPEIDYEKLAGFAGMSNPRSASNAWAKIRNKLNVTTGDGTAVSTPKKGGAKKTAADKDSNGDADGDSTKKTPRKRGPKKQEVDGDASPKKKGRPAKKKVDEEEEAAEVKKEIKSEGSDSQEPEPTGGSQAATGDDADEEV